RGHRRPMAARDRSRCRGFQRAALRRGALRAARAGARMRCAALLLLIAVLAGCAARRPAPVVERMPPVTPPVVEAPAPPVEKPMPTHTVKRGETLVGIAL